MGTVLDKPAYEPLGALRAAKRQARRQAARERIHARVAHPIDTPRLMPDPLEHPGSALRSTLTVARLLVVAFALHLFILATFFVANHVLASQTSAVLPERVKVRIVETPREPPPPPPPEPPEVEAPPAPMPKVVEAPPPPAPKPPVKRARPQEVVADPIAQPKAPTTAPRRVVGLSLESTVQGGTGPSFATGTSRMGETGPSAVAPEQAKQAAPSPPPNRVSTRFEQADVPVVKPRRLGSVTPVYPALLRERGIEADVVVVVTIGVDGSVTKVELVGPASDPSFNDAALAAARAERYEPATQGGVPVVFTQRFTIRFRLND